MGEMVQYWKDMLCKALNVCSICLQEPIMISQLIEGVTEIHLQPMLWYMHLSTYGMNQINTAGHSSFDVVQ